MDFNNNTIHSSSALMNLPELYSSANVNHLEKNSTSALNFSIDQILAASGTKQSNLSNSTANRCNSESSRLSPSTIIVQSPSECFNSPSTFSSKNGHFNQQQVLYPFYQSPLHYTFQPFLANYSSTINSNVANQQSMSIVTPGQQNFSQSSPLNASINQNQTKSGLQKVTPTLSNYLNVPSSYLKFGSILPVSTITGNSNAISEENLSASTLTSRNGKNKRPGNSSAEEMINEGGSKPNRRKRSWSRAVFSTHQRRCLEQQFISQIYINKSERRLLANSLNLSDAQVKVWFQNRRMKWRHSVEYSMMIANVSEVCRNDYQKLIYQKNILTKKNNPLHNNNAFNIKNVSFQQQQPQRQQPPMIEPTTTQN